jgi:hypothetical protein
MVDPVDFVNDVRGQRRHKMAADYISDVHGQRYSNSDVALLRKHRIHAFKAILISIKWTMRIPEQISLPAAHKGVTFRLPRALKQFRLVKARTNPRVRRAIGCLTNNRGAHQ